MTPSHLEGDKCVIDNHWSDVIDGCGSLKSSVFPDAHILYVHVDCPVSSSSFINCDSKELAHQSSIDLDGLPSDLGVEEEKLPGLESVLLIKNNTDDGVHLLESVEQCEDGSLDSSIVEGLPQTLFCQMEGKDETLQENDEAFTECSIKEEALEGLMFESEASNSSDCHEEVKDTKEHDIDIEVSFDESDSDSSEDGALHVIHNQPVPCRAKASLPGDFLCFKYSNKIKSSTEGVSVVGVYAKKEIAKKTRFGPVEGVCVDYTPKSTSVIQFMILNEDGSFKHIDVSNESLSNWMRYVRPAHTCDEQNLYLSQCGDELYFTASKVIHPKDELRVDYGMSYASVRKLKTFTNKKVLLKLKSAGEPKEIDISPFSNLKGDIRNWCCSHCFRRFRSATSLNIHVLTHAAADIETNCNPSNDFHSSSNDDASKPTEGKNPKPLIVHECQTCSKRFRSSTAFARHIKTHTSKKSFECPICIEMFPNVLNLKAHIHTHLVDGFYNCTYCSKKFREYKHVRKHIRSFHNGKIHQCLECSKCFPTFDKLRLHQLSHSEHREFLCADCGKQFKRKDKLSDHMKRIHQLKKIKIHSAEKIEDSQKDFSDYSLFVYKCHVCRLGFKRRGMLVNHMANRHPEIPTDSVPVLNLPILKASKEFFCQYCDKIYKSSTKRKAHILKNHPGEELPLSNRQMSKKAGSPEQTVNCTFSHVVGSVQAEPHNCTWCHKQYASKAKLLQHQRKKHPNHLPKSLLEPKKTPVKLKDDSEIDHCDAVGKIGDGDILLHDSLPNEISVQEFELSFGDGHSFTEGEFIIDAATLKRALKGEVTPGETISESLSGIGHLLEARPDQYFRVVQTSSGVSFARPVEIWDPLSSCQNLSHTDLEDENLLTPYSEG